jgi:hypothetical protein
MNNVCPYGPDISAGVTPTYLAIVGRVAVNETEAVSYFDVADLTQGGNITSRTPLLPVAALPIEMLSQRWAPLDQQSTPVYLYCVGELNNANGTVTGAAVTFDGSDTIEDTVSYTPSGYIPQPLIPRASYMTQNGLVTVTVADAGLGVVLNVALTVVVSQTPTTFESAGVQVYTSAPFEIEGGFTATWTFDFNRPSAVLPVVTWDGVVYAGLDDGVGTEFTILTLPHQTGPDTASGHSTSTYSFATSGPPRSITLFPSATPESPNTNSILVATALDADVNFSIYGLDSDLTALTYLVPATLPRDVFNGGAQFSWRSTGSPSAVCITWVQNTFTESAIFYINSDDPTVMIGNVANIGLPSSGLDISCSAFVNSNSNSFIAYGYDTTSPAPQGIAHIWRNNRSNDNQGPAVYNIFGESQPQLTNLSCIALGSTSYVFGGFVNGTLVSYRQDY